MSFDIAHMIATAIIIFLTVFGLEKVMFTESTPKMKKVFVTFLVLFALLFALNIFWPYGAASTGAS